MLVVCRFAFDPEGLYFKAQAQGSAVEVRARIREFRYSALQLRRARWEGSPSKGPLETDPSGKRVSFGAFPLQRRLSFLGACVFAPDCNQIGEM